VVSESLRERRWLLLSVFAKPSETQTLNIGYKFCRLDGSTKQTDRMPLIDQFNHDPSVFAFLISTLAGGTGLNLTGANKVVIFGRLLIYSLNLLFYTHK
jgi:SNF2 family DNA or RNA helicase